jgi:hypothetical protein
MIGVAELDAVIVIARSPSAPIAAPPAIVSIVVRDGADHAAEIECGDARAGHGRTLAGAGQHRRQPVEAEVDGEQTRKERAPERDGVAPEFRAEECRERFLLAGPFVEIDEARVRRHGMADSAKRSSQRGPLGGISGQEARRLGECTDQHERDRDRQGPGDDEEPAPPCRGQQVEGQQPSQRAAQRDADDRQRDGQRAVAARHVLGGQRRRIRQRAAQSEAGQKAERDEARQAGDQRHGAGRQAEEQDAADERDLAAEPIPDDARRSPAEHHPDEPRGQRGRE